MLTVSVVITTSLSSRSAPFGAPGVCYNLRFIIDVEAGPERSDEPAGPMKADFDAAGIARKRSSRIPIPNRHMKLESDSQRRLGLPPAPHIRPHAPPGPENFPNFSFEGRFFVRCFFFMFL